MSGENAATMQGMLPPRVLDPAHEKKGRKQWEKNH